MMRLLLLNIIVIVLTPICFSDSNHTKSSIRICEKCSPCWNAFDKNYGLCSKMNYSINPFTVVQPICIDTLILFIILFVSIVTLVPSCIWLFYLWIKHCHDDDTRYIIDGLIIT
ncbi:unnamed protein product [Rotaria sp. Silwood2]|nr:unnamed protein product [Rotaria sp. Silwood2]CAF2559994.1 unnamed protein product [Rotaria sp. Silwood2]CAF2821306.1 unnamed protein product [Rotaria sp. Silwood2]CAF2982503.1 unnamed protein product [Rotaria sp. Silwood2]CAF3915147.1 unnamed protein product [Rotaria sp. Silwood2]